MLYRHIDCLVHLFVFDSYTAVRPSKRFTMQFSEFFTFCSVKGMLDTIYTYTAKRDKAKLMDAFKADPLQPSYLMLTLGKKIPIACHA